MQIVSVSSYQIRCPTFTDRVQWQVNCGEDTIILVSASGSIFYSAGLCLTYRKSCPCEASCQCVAPFRSAHASSGRTFFQANCTLIASQIFRLTLQLQPTTHRTPLDRLACSMCFQVKLRVADVTLQGCLKVVGCLLVIFLCMEVLVQRAEIGQDVHIYNVLYKVSPTHSVPPRAQSVLLLHTQAYEVCL